MKSGSIHKTRTAVNRGVDLRTLARIGDSDVVFIAPQTTGVEADDEVWWIALVDQWGAVIAESQWRPTRPEYVYDYCGTRYTAVDRHGYNAEMLAALPEAHALPEALAALSGRTVAAWSWWHHDMIANTCRMRGWEEPLYSQIALGAILGGSESFSKRGWHAVETADRLRLLAWAHLRQRLGVIAVERPMLPALPPTTRQRIAGAFDRLLRKIWGLFVAADGL